MGIIQRQSIIGSFYSYLGALLGFLISGILFPNILSPDQNGVIKLLVSFSVLFSRFANLGFNGITNRFFPYFRDAEKKHHGFLFLAMTVITFGFILSVIVFLAIKPYIIQNGIQKSSLFIQYIYYVIPLIFFTLLFDTLDNYNKVLYNAVEGTFYKEVIQRIFILISVGLFYYKLISFTAFIFCYITSLSLPALLLSFSLLIKKQVSLSPQLGFISNDFAKSMISMALFGILGGFGGILISNIDAIMINSMLDLRSTGIYGITFYFGTLIIIPSRSLLKISSPLVANAIKDNDYETLRHIYYKSSLIQFIIGSLLFIGIWANIHNVFEILPKQYEDGKYVIFFIGLTNLLDMAIGINPLIIGFSKYYKYQTYFILVLLVFIVVTNYLLIPVLGIVGAALASFISKFLFNLMRYVFVLFKFRLQPYNLNFIIVTAIALLSYFLGSIIPTCQNFIFDIFIRSFSILVIFISLLLLLKVSPEINKLFLDILKFLKIKS